ncbi:exonuclease [Coprinopsis marcescibilis]|uniref:Mitochondrial escape protein 2 n=1 Tax=Coprinopsis marcescibilis TaxID=230819 RepID=A0A5C3KWK0_COPMA|nr:exonuclease [Coprinopsis marcescibilis]
MLRAAVQRRWASTVPGQSKEAWLYLDSIFPIQLAAWDLRHYVGILRQEYLLGGVLSKLSTVQKHGFEVVDVEPRMKDGGVFVRFSYTGHPEVETAEILNEIEANIREQVDKTGGFQTWSGLRSGNAWIVQGKPWKEDMNRYASLIVKATFDGPDVSEQQLYELFRPYGRIKDISPPVVVPAGTPRSALITYQHLRSASIARNVIYGLEAAPKPAASTTTSIRTSYQKPIQAHAVRDWVSGHPKITLPILIFLLGSLTYTIFDPIRSVMIEGKMLDWFDYQQYGIYKWLRANTVDRLSVPQSAGLHSPVADVWKERSVALESLKNYLNDVPSSIAFMHGPQGSGKTTMVQGILAEMNRSVLVIDCRELQKATSDNQLVNGLAHQTGYWPIFTLFNSMGNLFDLASVGLIGQKAGLTSSLTDQLDQVLSVVSVGLKRVAAAHRADQKHKAELKERLEAKTQQDVRIRERLINGTWHDGRLDCVAGNGIMCELGVGDEPFDDVLDSTYLGALEAGPPEKAKKELSQEDLDNLKALPIVVIRNYTTKVGSTKDELLKALAEWSASLVENQIAHVLVLSDNRENSKRLSQSLPSKPLYTIGLSDADASSALSFMKHKLAGAGIDVDFTPKQTEYVQRLGGRTSDLESLIHKVRSGQTVEAAVDEIISQGVSELRKNAFGDDVEDVKGLPWSKEQIWTIIKQLSQKPEISYYNLLTDFPFKGDETALRNMEHAEIITINTKNGRPASVKPGKPVLRWVFERLVQDPQFEAHQELHYNEKAIAKAESTISSCEQELRLLGDILLVAEPRHWYDWLLGRPNACNERARFLAQKMIKAERKVEQLDRRNEALKKSLTTL